MITRCNTHNTRPGALLRALCYALLLLPASSFAQQVHGLNWGREGAMLGTGIVLHGTALLQARRPAPIWTAPLERASVPRFDRVAIGRWDPRAHRAGDLLFGAALGLSLATSILAQQGEQPLIPVVIILETGIIASGLTNVVKEAVQRPRPYLYDPAISPALHKGRDDHHSFWSGHTANTAAITFATANMVQYSNASKGIKTATWVSAATIPAAMGVLRVRGGKHFPTDVVAGYAVGALLGWAVPYIHRLNTR